VKWVVLTQPAQLSAAQIAAFRAVIHDNNRPTQPLNGRKITSDRVKDMTSR
jgi:carbonic anhydrase